jgi:hypothetical protein
MHESKLVSGIMAAASLTAKSLAVPPFLSLRVGP